MAFWRRCCMRSIPKGVLRVTRACKPRYEEVMCLLNSFLCRDADFIKKVLQSFVSNKLRRLYQSVDQQLAAKKASSAVNMSTCRQEVESAYAAILRRSHTDGSTSRLVYHWRVCILY